MPGALHCTAVLYVCIFSLITWHKLLHVLHFSQVSANSMKRTRQSSLSCFGALKLHDLNYQNRCCFLPLKNLPGDIIHLLQNPDGRMHMKGLCQFRRAAPCFVIVIIVVLLNNFNQQYYHTIAIITTEATATPTAVLSSRVICSQSKGLGVGFTAASHENLRKLFNLSTFYFPITTKKFAVAYHIDFYFSLGFSRSKN